MLVREGDAWVLPAAGLAVTRCCVDYAFSLDLASPKVSYTVRLEREFLLRTADGAERKLDPGQDPVSLAPALQLWRLTVASVCAFDDGRLAIRFEGGACLDAPPDEGYEAWEVSGSSGLRLVAQPGGSVAMWGDSTEGGDHPEH